LPFTVVSAVAGAAGWNIQVRSDTGRLVSFTVLDGRPLAMRLAIQEKLEAEL